MREERELRTPRRTWEDLDEGARWIHLAPGSCTRQFAFSSIESGEGPTTTTKFSHFPETLLQKKVEITLLCTRWWVERRAFVSGRAGVERSRSYGHSVAIRRRLDHSSEPLQALSLNVMGATTYLTT